ncbi:MAG: CHAT domain-containing protein [Salibacteraceae bacterium]
MKPVYFWLFALCLQLTFPYSLFAGAAWPGILEEEQVTAADSAQVPTDSLITPELMVEYDLGMATIYHQNFKTSQSAKDLERSHEASRRNLSRLDMLHHGIYSGNLPRFSFEGRNQLFTSSLEIAFELWNQTGEEQYLAEMLEVAEVKQLSHWRHALSAWPLASISGVDEGLLKAERQLAEKLNKINGQISNWNTDKPIAPETQLAFTRERNSLEKQFNDLVIRIGKEAPAYYRLRYDYGRTPVATYQKQLTTQFADGALIQFFATPKRYYVLVLTPTELHIDTVTVNRELQIALRNLKDHGANLEALLSDPAGSFEAYTRDAAMIYQRVLSNSIKWIQSREASSINRLALVPDGDLQGLPFAALLTEEVKDSLRNYRELPYLIRDFALSRYASAHQFFDQFSAPPATTNFEYNFAGFAPTYPSKNEAWLSHNQNEVHMTVRSFFGNGYFAEDARETDFRTLAQETEILHLALVSAQTEMGPFMSFTPQKDSLHDGMLHAHELMAWPLSAGLLVLPNGMDPMGQQSGQTGWSQLARSLAFSGTPSLLTGLWRLDDPACSEVTGHYYDALAEGFAKDIALQKGQLNYLAKASIDAAHPYFWAGLIQSGELRSLEVSRGSEGDLIQVFGIMLIVVLVIFGGYRLGQLF